MENETTPTASDEDDTVFENNVFSYSLWVNHPSWSVKQVSDALRLSPGVSHDVGQQRRSVRGTDLPGRYRWTYWNANADGPNERCFFDQCELILAHLEQDQESVAQLIDSGGSIDIVFYLTGDENIGDILTWQAMQRFATLRISLGIEVFPGMRRRDPPMKPFLPSPPGPVMS